jgi:2-iminobutanoate/2-iminopropanoate deaminase
MSERQHIHTNNAPGALAPYSQGMAGAGLIYTSGQVGLDPATGKLVEGGVAAEAAQALTNITAILDAAGSSMDRVLKTTVFLVDMADYPTMNEVYRVAFPEPFPGRTTVVVSALPAGAHVEIEAVAVAGD